jgi:hypothetical protein
MRWAICPNFGAAAQKDERICRFSGVGGGIGLKLPGAIAPNQRTIRAQPFATAADFRGPLSGATVRQINLEGSPMKICRTLAVSLATLLMITHAASAQDWQQKKGRDRPQQQQQQPQQQAPQQRAAPGGGGACSPSGFAGLSRNCSANTGGCQRMPESCNRGWCCP